MGHGPMIPRSGLLARRSTDHCTLLHAGPIRSHGQDPRGPFSVKWWRYEQERPEEKLLENKSGLGQWRRPSVERSAVMAPAILNTMRYSRYTDDRMDAPALDDVARVRRKDHF